MCNPVSFAHTSCGIKSFVLLCARSFWSLMKATGIGNSNLFNGFWRGIGNRPFVCLFYRGLEPIIKKPYDLSSKGSIMDCLSILGRSIEWNEMFSWFFKHDAIRKGMVLHVCYRWLHCNEKFLIKLKKSVFIFVWDSQAFINSAYTRLIHMHLMIYILISFELSKNT